MISFWQAIIKWVILSLNYCPATAVGLHPSPLSHSACVLVAGDLWQRHQCYLLLVTHPHPYPDPYPHHIHTHGHTTTMPMPSPCHCPCPHHVPRPLLFWVRLQLDAGGCHWGRGSHPHPPAGTRLLGHHVPPPRPGAVPAVRVPPSPGAGPWQRAGLVQDLLSGLGKARRAVRDARVKPFLRHVSLP